MHRFKLFSMSAKPVSKFEKKNSISCSQIYTYMTNNKVEPILSGTVLGGHPVLSGRFIKVRNFFPLEYCNINLY